MILNENLLQDSITNKRPINKLFKSPVGMILDEFIVNDYVTADHIPDVNDADQPIKQSASLFFKEYQHRIAIEVDDLLQRLDANFFSEFNSLKRFPFSHTPHFFESFIAVEIMPNSSVTEFLIITPINTNSTGFDLAAQNNSRAAFSSLFHSVLANPESKLAFYITIDHLLEYLRTGQGKKKFLGIF